MQLDNENAFLTDITSAFKKEFSKLMANYESKAYNGAKGIEAFQIDCGKVRNMMTNYKCPEGIVSCSCCTYKKNNYIYT